MVREDNTGKTEVGLDMNKTIGEETSEETQGALTDRRSRGEIQQQLQK